MRAKEYVASKKRTYDFITEDASLPIDAQHSSPLGHVNNYFMKLKRDREDVMESMSQQVQDNPEHGGCLPWESEQ